MEIARSIDGVRALLREPRSSGRRIGFVPTMGALHEGHLSLVKRARSSCDVVAASIFVNPLQFGPNEDLDDYPRSEERDLELARSSGVDVMFLPSVQEMYGTERHTSIEIGRIGDILEGADRPGHFDGVATAVAKLLNIFEPDVTFFGQKDAQQVAVVRQMVRELSFASEIEVVPTVRESDGLALSSRNAYLDPDERQRALVLFRALQAGRAAWGRGESAVTTEMEMLDTLRSTGGVVPGYARAVNPETFGAPDTGEALLLVAARVGSTRLIDNILCTRDEAEGEKES